MFLKQTFNIGKDIYNYNQMRNEPYENPDKAPRTQKEQLAYENKLDKQASKISKGIMSLSVSVASFAYNYSASTTRFGLRGQDIQDQLKLQDKMVNKAFGVIGAGIVGGPMAMAGAVAAIAISEIISVSIQNKAYEYRKSIDEEQKAIFQERVGRAVFNSSRRT